MNLVLKSTAVAGLVTVAAIGAAGLASAAPHDPCARPHSIACTGAPASDDNGNAMPETGMHEHGPAQLYVPDETTPDPLDFHWTPNGRF